MAKQAIYLDHNASAPLLPEARAAIVAALDLVGNPSSVHAQGRALRNLVETARAQVATAAGAERKQVVFTGSATEAITQASVGGAKALGIDAIVVSAGEHAAVARAAEATGLAVKVLGLDQGGAIRVDQLAGIIAAYQDRKLLVCVHAVNNETGVTQPLGSIEALVGPTPHYLFVDAVQAFGKLPLEFASRAADMMAISAHKIGGPAGVGALFLKSHCDSVKLIPGGGQEQGRRGGTESAALLAGFGAAAEHFEAACAAAKTGELVAAIEAGLKAIAPDTVVFGSNRVGNVINFAVPGVKNAVAMMALDLEGIAVSSGSACSSGKVGRSFVLAAMGVAPELADCGLRISLGWSSTRGDVDGFLAAFERIVSRSQGREGRAA